MSELTQLRSLTRSPPTRLAAQAPIGAWLDRTGRKRVVMLWALLGLACAVLVLAWVPGFWPVLVANSIIEVVSGVFEPAIAALTVGLCTRDVLTARMGRNAAWSRAGNIAAAVLSGLLAWLPSSFRSRCWRPSPQSLR